MNKRMVKILAGVVLLLCLGAFVLAASPIKLFINGEEIATEISPKIVDGKVLASLRVIAEAFGAKVEWDDKTKSLSIEAKKNETDQVQVRLLEEALTPQDPQAAANIWAEGVKTRNGASSPWVESYEITKRYSFNDERYRFEINYTYTDSKVFSLLTCGSRPILAAKVCFFVFNMKRSVFLNIKQVRFH